MAPNYSSNVVKWRLSVPTILLGIAVGIAVLVYLAREPRHENRLLSEWMTDLGIVSAPQRLPRDPERRQRAQEAIRQIGPAAVPYLMHWIEYNRPVQNVFVRVMERLLRRSFRRPPNNLSQVQAYEAADALRLIHKVPNSAVDRLAVLVRGTDPTVVNCAAHALCGLAERSPAAATALVASHSPGLQIYGMEHLDKFSPAQVTVAVPALRQCLTNQNVPVRIYATNALLRFAPQMLNK